VAEFMTAEQTIFPDTGRSASAQRFSCAPPKTERKENIMVKGNVEVIKAARLEQGWTVSDLAKQIKVNKATISGIERGVSTSPTTAKRIADALGKPVTELFAIS